MQTAVEGVLVHKIDNVDITLAIPFGSESTMEVPFPYEP